MSGAMEEGVESGQSYVGYATASRRRRSKLACLVHP